MEVATHTHLVQPLAQHAHHVAREHRQLDLVIPCDGAARGEQIWVGLRPSRRLERVRAPAGGNGGASPLVGGQRRRARAAAARLFAKHRNDAAGLPPSVPLFPSFAAQRNATLATLALCNVNS